MSRVKIFTEDSGENLEVAVNRWLTKNPSPWSGILDMKYTQNNGVWSVLIYYRK